MADIGDGATFTMSGWAGSIVSMNWTGVSRAAVDITHLGTSAAKDYMPGDLYDGGELEITMHRDPDVEPPFTAAAATGTVTHPVPAGSSSGATAAATMFLQNWDPGNIAVDELMLSTVTFKIKGALTFVNAS